MYVGCNNPSRLQGYRGLGVTQLTAAASTIPIPGVSLISTAVGLVGSAIGGLFASSDPVRDAARKARIDQVYAGAMRGDQAAVDCLALLAQGVYSASVPDRGGSYAGSGCAVGSTLAATYAKVKWLEFKARHAAGQVAGVLIPQSDIPSQIVGFATTTLSNPLVLGGIALGAFLLFRKRR